MSIGAQLRASREARGLSIDAVAHTTRVQPRILAAIERDDVRVVPPRPFGRGFVKAYAREIGLDGDQTTRDYFAQFAPVAGRATRSPATAAASTRPTGSPRCVATRTRARWALSPRSRSLSWRAGRRRRLNRRRSAANVVGTSGVASMSAPASASEDDRRGTGGPPRQRRHATQAAAPAPSAPLTIVLTATSPSWVTADADGRRALFKTVAPGVPETIIAKREIVIRAGQCGALAWRVNGRELGPMGRIGQIRDVTITPRSAATGSSELTASEDSPSVTLQSVRAAARSRDQRVRKTRLLKEQIASAVQGVGNVRGEDGCRDRDDLPEWCSGSEARTYLLTSEAIDIRQPEVQQDDVGVTCARAISSALRPCCGLDGSETTEAQLLRVGLPVVRSVVDDQHKRRFRHISSGASISARSLDRPLVAVFAPSI